MDLDKGKVCIKLKLGINKIPSTLNLQNFIK
jgi:hypothetical protein